MPRFPQRVVDAAGFPAALARCAMPRVERIVPEWQERTLGEGIWLARRDWYRGEARQIVVRIEPGRVHETKDLLPWRLRRSPTVEPDARVSGYSAKLRQA